MALVSVIIPYYKKINHIKKTLNSVLNQTFQNFEIILIYDDPILDDLLFLEDITKGNSKIKIIKNLNNLGAGESRNIGMKNASGEVIAFLDADDYWFPNRLERQLHFMKKNNYKFTFCNYKKKMKNKIINIISKNSKINHKDLLTDCQIGLSTVFISRDLIKENLFPPLQTKEDLVAWLSITKNNICAYNFPDSLVEWSFSENSLSSNFVQKLFDGFRVYNTYLNFNFIKSLYYLFMLSINSIKRKF
ncbi:MAG: glycosyltransferase family 2 protein [Flavobacteriales bacterium TMED235]|nr:MAG: glycosyltransferase family 2 protein [Flavobacteriales bacterium TMED235]|tara:strand:- start:987 stop:1727 length:741 start_codon:yes stop_codon:yes gene_type:complete